MDIVIADTTANDQTIELGTADNYGKIVRSVITNSVIRFVEPCHAQVTAVEFYNCTIEMAKPATRPLSHCRFVNCRFLGEYGISIGNYYDVAGIPDGPMVVGCDFTEAKITGMDLCNADLPTIRFPRWPCVTFLDVPQHMAELKSLTFSKLFHDEFWETYRGGFRPPASSRTINWEYIVRSRLGRPVLPGVGPVDLEPFRDEFREKLSKLPYVLM